MLSRLLVLALLTTYVYSSQFSTPLPESFSSPLFSWACAITGLFVGVYLEANIRLRDVAKPILYKAGYGILAGIIIYGLLLAASLATAYL